MQTAIFIGYNRVDERRFFIVKLSQCNKHGESQEPQSWASYCCQISRLFRLIRAGSIDGYSRLAIFCTWDWRGLCVQHYCRPVTYHIESLPIPPETPPPLGTFLGMTSTDQTHDVISQMVHFRATKVLHCFSGISHPPFSKKTFKSKRQSFFFRNTPNFLMFNYFSDCI